MAADLDVALRSHARFFEVHQFQNGVGTETLLYEIDAALKFLFLLYLLVVGEEIKLFHSFRNDIAETDSQPPYLHFRMRDPCIEFFHVLKDVGIGRCADV